MQFRLTYAGTLLSTGNDSGTPKKADHKHEIRMAFRPQLERLWDVTPFLKTGQRSGSSLLLLEGDEVQSALPSRKAEDLAHEYSMGDWSFIPLVTEPLKLLCELDIVFLRPSVPGKVLNTGDIDGRLKTVLDALAFPDANQRYKQRTPTPGESPCHVLLADDRLVTKVSVETDQLLEFATPEREDNEARLLITVRLRPHEFIFDNMDFG